MFNHKPSDFQVSKILSPDFDRSGSGTVTFVGCRRRGLPYESSNDEDSSSMLGGGLVMYSVLRLIKSILSFNTQERKDDSLKELHETFIL